MNFWLSQTNRAARDAKRLLDQVIVSSRNPALFGEGKVADTLEGRFEVLTVFATLALVRLQEREEAGLAQEFTDRLFRSVDAGLREAGVGDLAVPKRMHRLAGDFYGRANVYGAAVRAGDASALAAALARNAGLPDRDYADAWARSLARLAEQQGKWPLELLLTREGWPSGDRA